MMKMKALFYYDQRNIQLNEVDIPEPEKDEVLLKVTAAGLCQTQINEFIEGPFIINRSPHKLTNKSIPLIVGHEFGGIVKKVGNTDYSYLLDKQAAVLPLLSCGKCNYCQSGKENLCNNLAYYGLLGDNGGFAEYACIKKDNIFLLEDTALLTFIEPILVAINAGNKVKTIIKNSKVCILGAGTVGICTAAVFRDYFEANVIINDILPNRLQRAKKAGFETISKVNLLQGYNIVVDCAGSDPTSTSSAFAEGFKYLLKGGVLLNIGTYFHPISIIPSSLLANEQHVFTSFLYNSYDVKLLPNVLASLNVDFLPFIEKISLENIIEEGYYRAEVDKDSFTRLVVEL